MQWLCPWVTMYFGEIQRRRWAEEGDGLWVGGGFFCGGLKFRQCSGSVRGWRWLSTTALG
jgi:hypothetical protein